MKRYAWEAAACAAQAAVFYGLPLLAGPTDAMGMVFLIWASVLALSTALGAASGKRIKWLYPLAAALLFLPSVPIYYNASAAAHASWYFVTACAGLAVGSLARRIGMWMRREADEA